MRARRCCYLCSVLTAISLPTRQQIGAFTSHPLAAEMHLKSTACNEKGRSLFEEMEGGGIGEEIAVCRWQVLGPKDVIILGLIHVKDRGRWTIDTTHFLHPSLCLSRSPSFQSDTRCKSFSSPTALAFTPHTFHFPLSPISPLPVIHFNLPVMIHDI